MTKLVCTPKYGKLQNKLCCVFVKKKKVTITLRYYKEPTDIEIWCDGVEYISTHRLGPILVSDIDLIRSLASLPG